MVCTVVAVAVVAVVVVADNLEVNGYCHHSSRSDSEGSLNSIETEIQGRES